MHRGRTAGRNMAPPFSGSQGVTSPFRNATPLRGPGPDPCGQAARATGAAPVPGKAPRAPRWRRRQSFIPPGCKDPSRIKDGTCSGVTPERLHAHPDDGDRGCRPSRERMRKPDSFLCITVGSMHIRPTHYPQSDTHVAGESKGSNMLETDPGREGRNRVLHLRRLTRLCPGGKRKGSGPLFAARSQGNGI